MNETASKRAELPDDPELLKALVREKDFRIAVLEEELRLHILKRFGASSEKANPDQLGLFNEAEATTAETVTAEAAPVEEISVPAHTRKKPGRKPLPAELERVRIVHDIPESEKPCPCGGGKLRRPVGEVVSEQLDIVPARIRVLQHARLKYGPCEDCDGVFGLSETSAHHEACRCGHGDHDEHAACSVTTSEGSDVTAHAATSEPAPATGVAAEPRAIVVAPLPAQPIPKSNASPGTCAYIATAKFEDGLPLYRQEKMLARIGVDISRGTLAAWMIRLGELIVPLVNLMQDTVLSYDVLQMDETTVQVLKEPGRAAQAKSRMWVRRGGPPDKPVVLFDYDPSRSGAVAARLLDGFQGYLQTDGYDGYNKVGALPGVTHVACLAHARRKFDEALKTQKAFARGGLAAEGLALIQRIYRIEKIAREAHLNAEQRQQLRNERSRPIWEELRAWLDRVRNHAPPSTNTGKALGYLDGEWQRLIRVLDDGRLEVDNNHCENAIRPFVLGRKAWLFSDTPAGADASARLYSVIETAKASNREPYAYLRHVFTELPKAVTAADVEALLPWNFAQPATLSVAA